MTYSDQQTGPGVESILHYCSSRPILQDLTQMPLFHEALLETPGMQISPFELWLGFFYE